MTSSNLIRWGGIAALVAGVLFVIVDIVGLLVFGFDQGLGGVVIPYTLFFRSTSAPVAGALMLLGLVGLYARQSEVTGIPGLISFLMAFLGTVLAQSFVWANLLANLGLALFGVSCLRAQVYPRVAAILLILGAVINGATGTLISGPISFLAYVGTGADIIVNTAVAWLGFSLFFRKREEARSSDWQR